MHRSLWLLAVACPAIALAIKGQYDFLGYTTTEYAYFRNISASGFYFAVIVYPALTCSTASITMSDASGIQSSVKFCGSSTSVQSTVGTSTTITNLTSPSIFYFPSYYVSSVFYNPYYSTAGYLFGSYIYGWNDEVCAKVVSPSQSTCAAAGCFYAPQNCSYTGQSFCFTSSNVNFSDSSLSSFYITPMVNGATNCPSVTVTQVYITSSPTVRYTSTSSSSTTFLASFLGGFLGLCFLIIGIMCCVVPQFRRAFCKNCVCYRQYGWNWAPRVVNAPGPVYGQRDQYGNPVVANSSYPGQPAGGFGFAAPVQGGGLYPVQAAPQSGLYPVQPQTGMYAVQPAAVPPMYVAQQPYQPQGPMSEAPPAYGENDGHLTSYPVTTDASAPEYSR